MIMRHKTFCIGLSLVINVFSLYLSVYIRGVSAGMPGIEHKVRAGAGGAEAYPYPSISGPWREGERYDGHGTALAAMAVSTGDFHGMGSGSDAYNRWDYDNDEIKVTIKTFIDIFGIKLLFEERSYPKAEIWAFSGEYVDESTAYSSGWIYMLTTTDDSDHWPGL